MAKDTTAKKTRSTTKQHHDRWHEERYGEHRDKLSHQRLKQLVEDICGKNYDEQAAAALVLLMDEVERSQFDRVDIQNITTAVGKAAFNYTRQHSKAETALITALRKQYSTREVCL